MVFEKQPIPCYDLIEKFALEGIAMLWRKIAATIEGHLKSNSNQYAGGTKMKRRENTRIFLDELRHIPIC